LRVLVTGSEGYLGCLVAQELMQAGHTVLGVDTGYYKNGWLYPGLAVIPETLAMDIRRLGPEHLDGFDAVVHLAELSNDPIGDLIGDITYDINHRGTVHLAETARAVGVDRFVYMSSCSVYGIADGIVDESSPVLPQTAYARCKALVERDLSAMVGDDFSPTFLRNATAFGASPRMRLDVVLNNLCGLAWTTNKITMISDGTPYRPLVHALDIAKAIRMTLESPREKVHGEIFNVGSENNNYRVRDIAEIVAAEFPGCELSFGEPGPDKRSYRVAFDYIREVLPGYQTDWDARAGVAQLHRIFEAIDMDEATFTGRGHVRLKQIEYLMRTKQVDAELYWTVP
jgi:nucleoside-diphosphate-sugar epimerase